LTIKKLLKPNALRKLILSTISREKRGRRSPTELIELSQPFAGARRMDTEFPKFLVKLK